MKNELIALFEKNGYELKIDEERLVAMCSRPAPRSRLGVKIEFHYRYPNAEMMFERCETWINNVVANKESRKKEKEAAKARGAEMAAKVKVGDIFVDSWGYEQTNIDMYEVVAKPTPKTVVVREIAFETVDGSEGMMCDRVRAVPGAFVSGEFKKRLDNYGGFKTNSFSCARPTTADDTHHRSWYY
jgi:hypothetical protein